MAQTHPMRRTVTFGPLSKILCLVVFYFGIQIVLRTFISNSADLDESDQMVLTQQAHWGYGPQPPLYTWTQIGFFKIFGFSIFALALFKNLLLCATYLLTYFVARTLTRNSICGIAAAASLFFIPQIAWESQRDLTHSVLASTLVMATWLCVLRIGSDPRWPSYLLLGVSVGLGFLSKYNYAVFLAALTLAFLSVRELRVSFLNQKMLLAAGIALLIALPNILWMLHHRDLTLLTASKFAITKSTHRTAAILSGIGSLLKSTLTFLGPLAVVLTLLFFRSGARVGNRSVGIRLMFRTIIVSFALIILGIAVFRATDIRDRWLQPILIYTPVPLIALLQNRLTPVHLKRILTLAALVMILVPALLVGRILLAARLHRTQPLNKPYQELAGQMRDTLRDVPLVITDTRLLGGNLRLAMPDKIFVTPELVPLFAPKHPRFGLVWDASKQSEPPESLLEFAERNDANLTNAATNYFAANYKYGDKRQMRVGLIVPQPR